MIEAFSKQHMFHTSKAAIDICACLPYVLNTVVLGHHMFDSQMHGFITCVAVSLIAEKLFSNNIDILKSCQSELNDCVGCESLSQS